MRCKISFFLERSVSTLFIKSAFSQHEKVYILSG